jgi:hypothetical protein
MGQAFSELIIVVGAPHDLAYQTGLRQQQTGPAQAVNVLTSTGKVV